MGKWECVLTTTADFALVGGFVAKTTFKGGTLLGLSAANATRVARGAAFLDAAANMGQAGMAAKDAVDDPTALNILFAAGICTAIIFGVAWKKVEVPAARVADDVPIGAPKGGSGQLVHLTDATAAFGIAKTGTINGSHGIFAVPADAAHQATALKVLRTGLPPGRTTHAVPIPDAALALFKRPVPVGPYSGWKYFGGVRYSPAGSLCTVTGELAKSASLIGPKVLIYGPDGVFYVGIATAAGLYIYGQTGSGE